MGPRDKAHQNVAWWALRVEVLPSVGGFGLPHLFVALGQPLVEPLAQLELSCRIVDLEPIVMWVKVARVGAFDFVPTGLYVELWSLSQWCR